MLSMRQKIRKKIMADITQNTNDIPELQSPFEQLREVVMGENGGTHVSWHG